MPGQRNGDGSAPYSIATVIDSKAIDPLPDRPGHQIALARKPAGPQVTRLSPFSAATRYASAMVG